MNPKLADALIWTGLLALLYFGILLAAMRIVDRSLLNRESLEAIVGRTRLLRRRRWIRTVPVLLAVSAGTVFAGAVLRLSTGA